jgi:hypothetical protein
MQHVNQTIRFVISCSIYLCDWLFLLDPSLKSLFVLIPKCVVYKLHPIKSVYPITKRCPTWISKANLQYTLILHELPLCESLNYRFCEDLKEQRCPTEWICQQNGLPSFCLLLPLIYKAIIWSKVSSFLYTHFHVANNHILIASPFQHCLF